MEKYRKGNICGNCAHWRYDDYLHLTGYCTLSRLDKFHGTDADDCSKYEYKFKVCTDYYNREPEMTDEEAYDCNECAKEHEQLAEWLKELKDLRGDCEHEEGKMLKRMSGGYVTYKVEYLLDNLAREISLLESYRKWKDSKVEAGSEQARWRDGQ